MEVHLDKVGKKFGQNWLYKDLNAHILPNSHWVIKGANGSGKSTLLQIIYGFIASSKGTVQWKLNERELGPAEVPLVSSFAAPYMDLPEHLTMQEVIALHFTFKKQLDSKLFLASLDELNLKPSMQKQVRFFSSGMKQRLKLLLAFYTDSQLLMLDEPCSNLDESGISWYRNHISQAASNRTFIIASNQSFEYEICNNQISID